VLFQFSSLELLIKLSVVPVLITGTKIISVWALFSSISSTATGTIILLDQKLELKGVLELILKWSQFFYP